MRDPNYQPLSRGAVLFLIVWGVCSVVAALMYL